MTFLDYLNYFFTIIRLYIAFLFDLVLVPGVSIGSIFLVGSLLYVVVKVFWPRA